MVVVHILHSPSPPFQACIHARPLQSCLTLCDPMECSPPGSSVHGILQARTLEWVACPPPGDLPDPVIKPASPAAPCVEGGFFTTEPPENPSSPRSSTDHLFFRIFVNGNNCERIAIILNWFFFCDMTISPPQFSGFIKDFSSSGMYL